MLLRRRVTHRLQSFTTRGAERSSLGVTGVSLEISKCNILIKIRPKSGDRFNICAVNDK